MAAAVACAAAAAAAAAATHLFGGGDVPPTFCFKDGRPQRGVRTREARQARASLVPLLISHWAAGGEVERVAAGVQQQPLAWSGLGVGLGLGSGLRSGLGSGSGSGLGLGVRAAATRRPLRRSSAAERARRGTAGRASRRETPVKHTRSK